MPSKEIDILIENVVVLTMNPDLDMFNPGFLAIQGDSIVAVGSRENLETLESQAHQVVDGRGGLLLPGLINSHTHAAMTLFRGLADDLPLEDWLTCYIFPAEQNLKGAMVYWGTKLACAEMILSGTTTFCDMYLFEDQVALAAREAGMRAVLGEVLYDFPSPNYGPVERGLKYTAQLIDDLSKDPLISVAVELHSPSVCSPDLLQKADRLSKAKGVPLIIHLAETFQEVARIRRRYQTSPVGLLHRLGLLDERLIAVHCVALSEEELALLARNRVKVVHCPESNMKLASGVAPVVSMLKKGIPVGLGTDGCASNNNLDLFQEMDMTAKLHKVHLLDPTVMDARTVLRLATSEGAKVLGLEKSIGTLEPGKKADCILFNIQQPHWVPVYDYYSHLVYAAKSSDVTQVFINGKQVLKNRHLTTLRLEEVMDQANRCAAELGAFSGSLPIL
jgi:5-methylthioadenosine/S-adenosylhomocysteine deaminase